jgi:multidrug efflux pump subunit AcrA (membrane-fusion protein)
LIIGNSKEMKVKVLIGMSMALVFMAGCMNKTQQNQSEGTLTNVTLTNARVGDINSQIELQGTTAYLEKVSISVPIAAYITRIYAHVGMRVKAGQIIAAYESKEQNALGGDEALTGIRPHRLSIRASRSGIVTEVTAMEGNYLSEGAPLCTIVETGSFAFLLDVPTEQRKFVHIGQSCIILLPDGTKLQGSIRQPMITMNTSSQAEQFVVKARSPFLPEGMNIKILLPTPHQSSAHTLVLPKAAVQSDATMTQFWVMRLRNDSTAERIIVSVGNSNNKEIEIHCSQLSPADRIILNGSYGLDDGAKVKVTNK